MVPLFVLLAGVAIVQLNTAATNLRAYVSPVDYLAPEYAAPAAGATYLFYPGERVRFDVEIVNKGAFPVSILLKGDASSHVSLLLSVGSQEAQPLARTLWAVGPNIRLRHPGIPEESVPTGSNVVLHPDASLVIPIDFPEAMSWPAGVSRVTANISLSCAPTCGVAPESNVFRFEMRTSDEQVDRLERHYRSALRAFLDDKLEDAARALQRLDAEDSGTIMGLFLHAAVAERAADKGQALRFLRAAERAVIGKHHTAGAKKFSESRLEDLLHSVRGKIRRLESAR